MQRNKIASIACLLSILLVSVTAFAHPAHAAISYSVSAAPSRINGGETTSLRIQIGGAAASTSYTFLLTVSKPAGAGQSTASVTFITSATGTGSGSVTYPSSSFTASSGTVNTDVSGTYTVAVDQTNPGPPINGVAASTFSVTFVMVVSLISPTTGSSVSRNSQVNITAQVRYVDQKPAAAASAIVNTLAGSVFLTETTPGIYAVSVPIQLFDPTGPWTVRVNATDGLNDGTGSAAVTVIPASIVVYDLITRNDSGSPTSVFNAGDTLYATFRLGYSGGGFLSTGSYKIQVRSSSGAPITTLQATYDPTSGVFSALTGYTVANSDPDGSWQLTFPAFSLNDTYGNKGPNVATVFKFTVHSAGTPDLFVLNTQFMLVAASAVASAVAAFLLLRRFNTTDAPFEELFKLTGGELSPPMTLMITEEPSSGGDTLVLQLIHRELSAGRSCGIISYTNFPSAIIGKMKGMGWDPSSNIENGTFKIIDCYSALAGIEGAQIEDPSDLTEVSIRVNAIVEKFKPPFSLFLDSITPVFNGPDAKAGIRFINALCARVKSKGGTFIIRGTKGSLSEEIKSQLEAMMDGAMELSVMKKGRSLARSLMVKKIFDRQVSSYETGFEILSGKGIGFKRSRIHFH